MKRFNTTGKCIPEKHYMVDISDRVVAAKKMVDEGSYFTINRGRQYGKTTLLSELRKKLSGEYLVLSISFEGLEDEVFENAESFYGNFFGLLYDEIITISDIDKSIEKEIEEASSCENLTGRKVSSLITKISSESDRPIVIIIDEVDQAGNYEVFITFLGLLRKKYLDRDNKATFHSVILAGVYDIKNLKLRIRSEKEHQYNSPWNIADSFDADMSFSSTDIEIMLRDYEKEHATGMDVAQVSKKISDYTSGYPFLVSRICQLIDESEGKIRWNKTGVEESVSLILSERNTLFDDMIKKLTDFPELKSMLYDILYDGKKLTYNIDDHAIDIASRFNFIRDDNKAIAVSNRIFETRLYNLFIFESLENSELAKEGSIEKNQFIRDGHLDMKHVIERFIVHYNDIYGNRDEKFHEKEGRKYFLFYLKPIINGTGNYYVEAETRDETRTDVVVDYLGEQYVIELKIWRGDSYNERGEKQLSDYLDYFHINEGYMISFNFNKNKTPGVKEIKLGDKLLVEGVV